MERATLPATPVILLCPGKAQAEGMPYSICTSPSDNEPPVVVSRAHGRTGGGVGPLGGENGLVMKS